MIGNKTCTAARGWLAIAVFTFFTFTAAMAAPNAAAEGCTLASAAGSWSYNFSGSVFSTEAKSFVPAASMGVITFDGKGGATGSESFSVAGNTTDENYTGTYTENSDCTGTFTLLVKPSGQTVTGKFVSANDDNEAYVIFTSPGITMNGTTKRVKYRGI
jgi:hypothetical protein